jgi:hypothetical protein
MPKIEYIKQRFNSKAVRMIGICNEIIETYMAEGYQLTLRQLYYRLVSKNIIANKKTEYKQLVALVNNARLAGRIDWDAIIDRTRNLASVPHWGSPTEVVEACAKQFRLDRWANQPFRPEVWIEKDALVGTIEGVCDELHIPYFSCRGYTSQSEMWSGAQRMLSHLSNGQRPFIIHLGDHDPSGKDMSRDICHRMELFIGEEVKFKRIALNMTQIKKYEPPPNPVKLSDSRCQGYISEFGHDSWELDALEPRVIRNLIANQVASIVEDNAWSKDTKLENKYRAELGKVAAKWPKAVKAAKARDKAKKSKK